MPIYTRTGDDGTTGLYGGKRTLKCNELVEAYGALDELNSWLGLIIADVKENEISILKEFQSDLLAIGAYLAGLGKIDGKFLDLQVAKMEKTIDDMEAELTPLHNFILPGGTSSAAKLHIGRAITRRVERQVVALSKNQMIDKVVVRYLNRLSDLLFTIARYLNKKVNEPEVVWKE